MTRFHTNNHRRAISLLELLLVMSASAVVLSLSGVLLHRVMLVQIESRSRTNVERTSLRLAGQFRSDVHSARDAKPDNARNESGVFLHLTTIDDRTIDYSRDNDGLVRVESGGDRPSRHEAFEFPPQTQLAIEQGDAGSLALTLQLHAREQPLAASDVAIDMNPTPVSLRVEATIGRDLRLQLPPAATEATP
ncbi:MAG: hypothetical protein U0805_09490 [Pirellulales bacterium]